MTSSDGRRGTGGRPGLAVDLQQGSPRRRARLAEAGRVFHELHVDELPPPPPPPPPPGRRPAPQADVPAEARLRGVWLWPRVSAGARVAAGSRRRVCVGFIWPGGQKYKIVGKRKIVKENENKEPYQRNNKIQKEGKST